ncbi:ABC transporter permease [Alphaproteobacteria bacterium]|nr:ABC transporter permease [Alphaproteobacteria bacterium]
MFSSLEFLIAMRYLRSKRKEGFISVIAIFSFVGIMIGVATLIIVMSVMNGFRHDLIERILGINSHLTIYSKTHQIKNYQEILTKIRTLDNVSYANAIVESQAMLSTKSKNAGGLIRGISSEDLLNKQLIRENITAGDINKINDKNSIIIGSILAQNLSLKINDRLKIISAETNDTIIGAIPRIKTYTVAGIFDSGMYEYDSTTIFMNFKMAQTHFRINSSASALEIFSKNPSDLSTLKQELYKIIIDYDDIYFNDWQQVNSGFIEALKVESTVMFLILTLIILVAVFNIISSMIMLVNDKNKNIALLRTLGMTKGSILRIFLICGSSIGFLGTIFGLIIGITFSININNIKLWLESITDTTLFNPAIYFLSTLPSKILISDVVVITSMAFSLSFLATLYPAFKASKANPAEILRYE